jgi:hypothetical protein
MFAIARIWTFSWWECKYDENRSVRDILKLYLCLNKCLRNSILMCDILSRVVVWDLQWPVQNRWFCYNVKGPKSQIFRLILRYYSRNIRHFPNIRYVLLESGIWWIRTTGLGLKLLYLLFQNPEVFCKQNEIFHWSVTIRTGCA